MTLIPSDFLHSNQFPFRGNRRIWYSGAATLVIVIALTVLMSLLYLRQLTEERVIANSQALVKSLDLMFESDINTVDVALTAINQQLSVEMYRNHSNVQLIDRYLDGIQRSLPHADVIRATNEQGDVLYGIKPPYHSANVADREYFQLLRDNPNLGLVIFKPHMGKVDQVWRWTFIRRINKPDGSFGGVVFVAFAITEIQSMLNRLRHNSNDVISLRDKEFRLISRQLNGHETIPIGDSKVSQVFREAIKANPLEGTYEVNSNESIDGIKRIYSYRINSKYGFLIADGIDWRAAFASWYWQVWFGCGTVFSFALGIFIFVRLLFQKWKREEYDLVKQYEDQLSLKESEERFRTIIDLNKAIILQINPENGRIVDSNEAACEFYGWTRQVMCSKNIADINELSPEQCAQKYESVANGEQNYFIFSHRLANGEARIVEVHSTPIKVKDKIILVAIIHDITKRKQLEEQVEHMAYYDALTQLPNRLLFHDRLEQEIKKALRTNLLIALLFIDLDWFKEVNDTLGHEVGDLLLIEAAGRIKSCVRNYDTVARLGGDEFMVVLAELTDLTDVGRVAQKIINSLSEPYKIKDSECRVSASIGIAIHPVDASNFSDLLKDADQAMYKAKQSGRSRFQYFTKSMQDEMDQRTNLIGDLRHALENSQFEVYYQPIVNLTDNSITKAEALLRWNHPKQGQISPSTFIPIAEDIGLIHEIGDWVFDQAITQAKTLTSMLNSEFQISVNQSPKQFNNELSGRWIHKLRELGLPGNAITIEITEGLLMSDNVNVIGKLLDFRDAGIQVSIDDFGTGYSALSYLKKFHIDYLKIDQLFIRNLEIGIEDFALCEAMVVMAHKLGIKVIAEGVETERQRDLLRKMDCDYGQGYLFSMPLPASQFEALLKSK